MLIAVLTTLLGLASVCAAPSPQPALRQTNRDAIVQRISNKGHGLARRQGPSPRAYSRCANSAPGDQGTVFATYDNNISFISVGDLVASPGNSLEDYALQCSTRSDCAVTFFLPLGGNRGTCHIYSAFEDPFPSDNSLAFKSISCAELAAANPGIASLDCCNFYVALV